MLETELESLLNESTDRPGETDLLRTEEFFLF